MGKLICRCIACRPAVSVFTRWLLILIALMTACFALSGCGRIRVPCVPGVTCPAPPPPTPAPVPTPTPTPVPTPTPTPAPPGDDPIPCHDEGLEAWQEGFNPVFGRDVDTAITWACTGYETAETCPAGTFVPDWQDFVARVRLYLQARGYRANYDWNHGDSGLGSELTVWRASEARPGGRLEAYQVVTTRNRVRRPPGAARWHGRIRACGDPPECPLVVTEEHHVRFKVVQYLGSAGARWLDLTPEYFYGVDEEGNNAGPCLDPNTGAPRRWCDLGVDGGEHGVACQEALVGSPEWKGGSVELETNFRGNPFLARIVSGSGWVTVCGERLLPQGPGNAPVKVCINVEAW